MCATYSYWRKPHLVLQKFDLLENCNFVVSSYIWLRHALNKTILWLADHLSIKAESEESVFTRILRLEKENKYLQALVSTYKDAVKSSEITEVRKLLFICNFQMHVEPQQT